MIKIWIITMALVSFLHAGWFDDLFGFNSTPPFKVDINMSKAGNIAEKEFKIKKEQYYTMSFTFYTKDKVEYLKMLDFLAGTRHVGIKKRSAIPIPIKITILKTDKKKKYIILKSQYITNNISSWNGKKISRNISNVYLKKGIYKMKVESLEDFPELKNINMSLIVKKIRTKK